MSVWLDSKREISILIPELNSIKLFNTPTIFVPSQIPQLYIVPILNLQLFPAYTFSIESLTEFDRAINDVNRAVPVLTTVED